MPGNVIDLRDFLDMASERIAGECTPVNHDRIERVVVVLKKPGELDARDLELVSEMAAKAAVHAGKIR